MPMFLPWTGLGGSESCMCPLEKEVCRATPAPWTLRKSPIGPNGGPNGPNPLLGGFPVWECGSSSLGMRLLHLLLCRFLVWLRFGVGAPAVCLRSHGVEQERLDERLLGTLGGFLMVVRPLRWIKRTKRAVVRRPGPDTCLTGLGR